MLLHTKQLSVISISLLFLILGCGTPDGKYNAIVTYYNPNTGTHSTYTLPVYVRDNRLMRIDFPKGGWLDTSNFEPSRLSWTGQTCINTDRNYQYCVDIK